MVIVRQQFDREGGENQVSAAGPGNSALQLMLHKRQVGGGGDLRGSDEGDRGGQCTPSQEVGSSNSVSTTSTLPDVVIPSDQHFFAKTVRSATSGSPPGSNKRHLRRRREPNKRYETREDGSTVTFETLDYERRSFANSIHSAMGDGRCQDPVDLTSLDSLHPSSPSASIGSTRKAMIADILSRESSGLSEYGSLAALSRQTSQSLGLDALSRQTSMAADLSRDASGKTSLSH